MSREVWAMAAGAEESTAVAKGSEWRSCRKNLSSAEMGGPL